MLKGKAPAALDATVSNRDAASDAINSHFFVRPSTTSVPTSVQPADWWGKCEQSRPSVFGKYDTGADSTNLSIQWCAGNGKGTIHGNHLDSEFFGIIILTLRNAMLIIFKNVSFKQTHIQVTQVRDSHFLTLRGEHSATSVSVAIFSLAGTVSLPKRAILSSEKHSIPLSPYTPPLPIFLRSLFSAPHIQ